MTTGEHVVIDYTNHRGERAPRTIRPIGLRFGSSDWRQKPQWLLAAVDVEKQEPREFAMAKIHTWGAK